MIHWPLWEGPIELLLAKVKNASGRIGIFQIGNVTKFRNDEVIYLYNDLWDCKTNNKS